MNENRKVTADNDLSYQNSFGDIGEQSGSIMNYKLCPEFSRQV